jgi:hypothetical protein
MNHFSLWVNGGGGAFYIKTLKKIIFTYSF